ncbi:4-hydroxyproline 2-epimerase [Tolypocladium ophioglossoides CBS 100239]|uniref:4-hydroxyproline 2-epimerase n=1 Tax=Tolypocladium ophioglossoides (strain CBS 100239) TaxID=1163406 RepID=A0A0L0N2H3_TOLOC|nr:4-hydroxyproline 2-epimerase [Tolypocladium ophioglossoides CBS 100239]
MRLRRTISLICCHAEGEVGDVIVGGVLDIPASSMHEKLMKFINKHDDLRKLLLHEPRGRLESSAMIVLPPCDPRADAGFLIMAPGDWVPMSGSNTICTTTVLLETGIVPMTEPTTTVKLDTAAGLIIATAECENGSCKSVSFDNVAAFVYALDMEVDVPGIGSVLVDIAYGGQWYVVVQAEALGVRVTQSFSNQLIEFGKLVKAAVSERCMPTHPENPAIRGINNVIISEPFDSSRDGSSVKHTVVVTPGRLDRSPCGTGSSARLAILYARKQIDLGQEVKFSSIIDTMFLGRIKDTQPVGTFEAVLPNIKGREWITGHKQGYVDPSDPFQEGFQL